ncbi:MAG: hypothetical protein WA510_01010 [Acidobacteriaceae bacterium]
MNQACRVVIAICLLGLVSCSSNRPTVVNFPPIISVAAMSGTPQSHEVNGAFGQPLTVTVTTNGLPAGGMDVTFTAPATGASGTFASSGTNTTTAKTNASGVATPAAFTANGTAGSYMVMASVPGAPTLASFSLTNTISAPAGIRITGGSPQSAAINAPFTLPLAGIVVDVSGNPISSAIVTFTAPATGASGTFASGQPTETDTTDANGAVVSSTFTANNTSGSYAVTAMVGTVSANFILTNSAGAPATITGTPQSENATINTAFAAPLSVTVLDSLSNPVSGVAVTFSAPAGSATASGTFTNGTATETDATNSSGMATSTSFTANNVTGSYMVTAAVTGLPAVDFNLTNQVASTTYVFSLDGQEAGPIFYALAGIVQIDGSGNVLDGEQDYNDGQTLVSPEPSPDTISSGSLTVDSTTGQGTLTLNTSNTSLGVSGVETFGVQFVNRNHALIIQFDGSATSSGSLDLQTSASSVGDGGYAFTLTGVDSAPAPIGFGGVFTVSGGGTALNGVFDTNDAGNVIPGTTLSGGTLSTPDPLGRGTLTGLTNPATGDAVALNYYIVGPEVIRLIDVDTLPNNGSNDSAVGSAFGQGTNATGSTNASLGNSVFGIAGDPILENYAAAGMFSTTSGSGTFSGVADDDELSGILLPGTAITGNYSVAGNGYGSLTIAPGSLGDISLLGIYMTDPSLNLLDPNNTTSGLGGGLIADMDAVLAGGTGILIPQIDTSTADFTGNYAFGAQDINEFCCEFDFVGLGSVTGGVLAGTGLVSDPFLTLTGGAPTNTGATFSGTATPDTSNVGRYTMLTANTDPLNITIAGTANPFDVVIYQGSGGQLLWLNEDASSEFLGSLQQQGSLAGLPAARKPKRPVW